MDTESQQLRPPAITTRIFGWAMLATLCTYLLNNYLAVSHDLAPAGQLLAGELSAGAFVQLVIYLAGIGLATWFVLRDRHRTLRADSAAINSFNAWLIRCCFWSVLFVGLADMAISFLRVEDLLESVLGEDMARQLGRPNFRGLYVHYPMIVLGFVLGSITRTLGFHWLAFMIVIAELTIVITRFIFSYEQAFMGDLVRFWYAALFLFASAYTLLHEGHVRVDVFYAGLSRRAKGRVNATGAILFGMALCWTVIIIGFKGKASVIYGPLSSFEVSQSGFGMYTKYLMAGYLGIFAISMLIQFVSQLFEARADSRNDPGARELPPEDHATS